jgi:hypothetical protein
MLYCPRCGAEYREGYSSCSDCHVLLVRDLSRETDAESLAEPGDPNLDPFCSFWRGDDAQICAELCSILDEAGIPHRTVHRADHLFHFPTQIPHELGVPASFYEKAELAVKEAFGTEDASGEDAVRLLPSPYPKFEEDPLQRNTDDATVEIWSGEASPSQEKIEESLRENKVLTRWQWIDREWFAFVTPEDEPRAREIIRVILEPTLPAS